MAAGFREWILGELLERWERSLSYGSEQPLRPVALKITTDSVPAYFDEADPEPRLQFLADARALEATGLVSLRWGRGPRAHELEAISLDVGRAREAYVAARRLDPEVSRGEVREVVRAALEAIARLERPERMRALSTRLFGDSKRLGALAGRIAQVLREWDPGLSPAAETPADVLREYGVSALPGLLLLRGDVAFDVAGERLTTAGWRPFVGIPESAVYDGAVRSVEADAVLTVENAESFHALCALPGGELPERLLVVYGGGFSTRAQIRLLRALRRLLPPEVLFFHWGDLDLGGFRILLHMRREVSAEIRPVAATTEVVERYRGGAMPLPPRQVEALDALASDPLAADLAGVIARVADVGVRIEQEAIDPREVLGEIAAGVRRGHTP